MLCVKKCSVLVIDEGTDMNTKLHGSKPSAEHVVKDIRRATRRHFASEDKIRIVLEGLRGEDSA